MNNFFEMYNLPRLNQEEIENVNKPITSNKIESVKEKKKKSQETKIQDQTASQVNSTKLLELTPIFLKLFQKIEEKRMLSNSFYEASITLVPIPDKDITKKQYICIFMD